MREPLWLLDRDDDSVMVDLTMIDGQPHLISGVQSNNGSDAWLWEISVLWLEDGIWTEDVVWTAEVNNYYGDDKHRLLSDLRRMFDALFPKIVADPRGAARYRRHLTFPEPEDGPEILAQNTPIATIYT